MVVAIPTLSGKSLEMGSGTETANTIRPLTTKLYARNYRGLVFYLSALADAGMLKQEEARLMR